MALDPTPLRALGVRGPDGCVLLRDAEVGYRDGAEDDVLRLIAEAKDLRSTSDELIRRADGWAQTYHLHPSRANVVRCLDLPATARVLEIGAGCGAITRYLGETCASVDALEPVPVRAASARARTRDLDNVEVFVGELADVPCEPVYDVVVVIGVLEYVGNGTADRAPYIEFLRGIRDRLVDGGTLVLAIENQLGVKYLAGAPEDHTNRMFDSLEDYPSASPARTFSRRQLQALLDDAGLASSVRVAFPDYKITRAVLGEFPDPARSLLYRIPQFPSPDWMDHRPRLADEFSLWRTLVRAGLELDTGNSFVVVAGKGAASPLWRDGVAGVFYSVGRRTAYTAETVVEVDGDSVRFRRRAVETDGHDGDEAFTLIGSVQPYVAGEDLLDHVVRDRDADISGLIATWVGLVDEVVAREGSASLDLVPHNLVVDLRGQLQPIDVELQDHASRDQVIRRGVYWLAYRIARLSPADRWPDALTVRDLARTFGVLAGLDSDGEWLETAIREEAVVQTEIHFVPAPGDRGEATARQESALREALDHTLASMPLGQRPRAAMISGNDDLLHEIRLAQQHSANLTVIRDAQQAEIDRLQAYIRERDELNASRLLGVVRRYRAGVNRALPDGTRRREAYGKLFHRRG